jgi:hypothetical protein
MGTTNTETHDINFDDALEAGLARIGGTCAGPGKVAYYADETGSWYVVDEDDVADLGRRLLSGDSGAEPPADIYSVWCAETDAEELDSTGVAELETAAAV